MMSFAVIFTNLGKGKKNVVHQKVRDTPYYNNKVTRNKKYFVQKEKNDWFCVTLVPVRTFIKMEYEEEWAYWDHLKKKRRL